AFTLVGHSLGALMASAYASLYPGDVSRLVLASVAQGYG
ncbi:alpha/beta fold hydrolase, partial [Alcaligenes pakistanensis]